MDAQANASEQRGTLLPRERQKLAYDRALVERYKHLPEVGRIARHRHLPTAIYKVLILSLPSPPPLRILFITHDPATALSCLLGVSCAALHDEQQASEGEFHLWPSNAHLQ